MPFCLRVSAQSLAATHVTKMVAMQRLASPKTMDPCLLRPHVVIYACLKHMQGLCNGHERYSEYAMSLPQHHAVVQQQHQQRHLQFPLSGLHHLPQGEAMSPLMPPNVDQ